MLKIALRSAIIGALCAVVLTLGYAFAFGSYTYYPTVDAAELMGIAPEQQAEWMQANTKEVRGWDYAVFLLTDSMARPTLLSAASVLFGYGALCAFFGALFQRRSAAA